MKYRLFMLLLVVFTLSGCAQFSPIFETPTVSVTNFQALPGQGEFRCLKLVFM